ncbi:hypothetical protein [Tenacibaculum litopenaei]|jgi:hypothetical protein|uniref:hypothetical protein n=1 Tax=Tenacibaculum litopenaei TaxID=396016 RepID=UPI0038B602AA
MKTETIKIKLVSKEGYEALNRFIFIEIPVVSNEVLFNQVFMVKDFGFVFLN